MACIVDLSVTIVVVPGVQVDRLAFAAALGQAVDVDEDIEARVRLSGGSSRWPR
jgi:hypothetical protein